MNKQNLAYCLLATLLPLLGCSKTEQHVSAEIHVSSFEHDLNIDSVLETTLDIAIQSDELLIGDIVSAAANDSIVYTLDNFGTVSLTDIRSQQPVLARNLVGEGPGEVVAPQALTYDNGTLYIYDLPTRSVSSYDARTLEFKNKVTVDVSAMSFAVCGEFMAFSNIDLHGGVPQMIVTDTLGTKIQEYFNLPKTADISYALTASNIYKYTDSFYFTPLWENKLYEIPAEANASPTGIEFVFDGFKNRQKKSSIKNDNEISKRPIVINVFQNNGVMAAVFLYKDLGYFNFSAKNVSIANGRIAPRAEGMPFFPMWQSDSYLIGKTSDPELVGDGEDATSHVLLYQLRHK